MHSHDLLRSCWLRSQPFARSSLPGAIAMYALSIGVSRISEKLPLPVYALLSGLNAAVVGVIAFAAVQLAEKGITDRLSRLIVILSACAGLCYNALWYFPVLVAIGGVMTVLWDQWLRAATGRLKARRRRANRPQTPVDTQGEEPIQMVARDADAVHMPDSRGPSTTSRSPSIPLRRASGEKTIPQSIRQVYMVSLYVGIWTIVLFVSA